MEDLAHLLIDVMRPGRDISSVGSGLLDARGRPKPIAVCRCRQLFQRCKKSDKVADLIGIELEVWH